VAENLARVCRHLECKRERVVRTSQVHGADILVLREPPREPARLIERRADGVMTDVPGLCLTISTADCLPIFLYDPVHEAVAVLHAGWRGTVANIVIAAMLEMRFHFSTQPQELLAALGPAIGPCCYEVDEPVVEAFLEADHKVDLFIHPQGRGRWRLDLKKANLIQLLKTGVEGKQVFLSEYCTACSGDLFYSHRATGGRTGRQLNAIGLKG